MKGFLCDLTLGFGMLAIAAWCGLGYEALIWIARGMKDGAWWLAPLLVPLVYCVGVWGFMALFSMPEWVTKLYGLKGRYDYDSGL